jgi:hypothetical protein
MNSPRAVEHASPWFLLNMDEMRLNSPHVIRATNTSHAKPREDQRVVLQMDLESGEKEIQKVD